MKLGIIGAMAVEIEDLKARLQGMNTLCRAGMEFYEGVLEGLPVVVCRSGVGKVHAAMCAQILVDCFAVTHIVNTGIAGSLRPELDIGDLLISQDAMYHDFDCTVFPGYAYGQVPGVPMAAFPADPELMELARQAAEAVRPGHCVLGRVASGDQFVARDEQKKQIIAHTGASCTEMEGAAIAHAAYRNGVPFVILRAISDKADGSAQVDYPSFENAAAHTCAKVTAHLAKLLAAEK